VGLGDLTKQFAKEALAAQVSEVMEPSAQPASDALSSIIMGQVQAMQNALKDDQELLVHCTAGREIVRVLEMFAPSQRLLVLTGVDAERTVTRVVSPAEAVQLVCKPAPVKDGAKPTRLRFVSRKPG